MMNENQLNIILKSIQQNSKVLIVNCDSIEANDLKIIVDFCSFVCFATDNSLVKGSLQHKLSISRDKLIFSTTSRVANKDYDTVVLPFLNSDYLKKIIKLIKSVERAVLLNILEVMQITPDLLGKSDFKKYKRGKLSTYKNGKVPEKCSFFVVNYNTSDYIRLLIESIHEFVKSFNYDIWIFDNSDKEKLVLDRKWKDVHVIDNTKGQVVNYKTELFKYCDKDYFAKFIGFISVKHALAVQYGLNCEDISDDFILCDSDIVIKRDIDFINDKFACIGKIRKDGLNIPRLLPFLCYINRRECRENNVKFFDQARFHGCVVPDESRSKVQPYMLLDGMIMKGYDTGACFLEDVIDADLDYELIDIFKYCIHFGSGSRNDRSMKKNNYESSAIKEALEKHKIFMNAIEYKPRPDFDKEIYKQVEEAYSVKSATKKYAIYTCITGNYDNLFQQDKYDHDNFDYICFTDSPKIRRDDNWKIVKINKLKALLQIDDNTKISRFVKTHPHLFLKGYSRSIWIDGNIRILSDNLVDDYISLLGNDNYFLTSEHPYIVNVYEEIEKCISLGKDDPAVLEEVKAFLTEENFSDDYEHTQTGIILRNHNNAKCKMLMEEWWKMINKYSKRDQTSFNYVFWKNGGKFLSLPWDYVTENLFEVAVKHNC